MIAADGRNAQYPYLLVFSCHWVRHRALDSPATRALPRVSHEIVMVPFYTRSATEAIQTVPPHPSFSNCSRFGTMEFKTKLHAARHVC